MAIGLIEIVNDALATLGEQPIVDLKKENATSTSILVNQKYPLVLRALLMEDDWNCARITQKLAKLNKKTRKGYKYTYQLPKDPECLGVRQISLNDGETFIDLNAYYNYNAGPKESLFDIDQDELLCNAETVWIKYTGLVDAAMLDPFLASAFSARLAAELAYAIPASTSLAQYLDQIATKKLKKAKSRNALNRNILNPEGEVIGCRYHGHSDRHVRVDMSEEME